MPKPQLRVLSDVDGRSAAARNARRLTTDLIRDIGGDPTVAQSSLIERAAFTATLLEDAEATWFAEGKLDVQAYGVLHGHLRRTLEALGLNRHASTDATGAGIAIIRRHAGRSAA